MADTPPEESASDDVESLWLATTPDTDYAPLDGDLEVDVAVVGGGITGLTAAIELQAAGREVAVLEADRVGTGTSGKTTAKLTSQHGLKYERLCSEFGRDRAKQYADANEAAIDAVERRIDDLDVDADFERTPAYVFAESEADVPDLNDEAEAARRLGLPATVVDSVDAPVDAAGALRFDDQAQFHPGAYLRAVAAAVDEGLGHVFEETPAVDVDEGRGGCEVETRHGTVRADDVVVASHFPFADRAGYFARMHPSRAYLLAVEIAGDLPEGMYLGADSPSPTFRPHPVDGDGDEDLLVVGGQSHEPSVDGPPTSERYRRCEAYAREHFDVESVRYRWSSHDYVPVDGVPYVGHLDPASDHLYVGVGFAKWGMTGGTAAGTILSDLIVEGSNPWADVFDPMRFVPSPGAPVRESKRLLSSGLTFLTENSTVGARWVGDRAKAWLSTGVDETDLPARGEGRVVRHRGRPVAVHRDDDGEVHASSAVCPHMWCIVDWNDAERTWDCPCHGSRFDCDGSVERGPALEDLPTREL